MDFIKSWSSLAVPKGHLALSWIGQAGFLIKTEHSTIAIDPYLTDSVYHLFQEQYGYGFKRLAPALFPPGELEAEYLFCSHEHGDHLDTEGIVPLMHHARSRLFANAESCRIARQQGVLPDQIQTIARGSTVEFDEFRITALPSDHGDLSPEAMGFLFDFAFLTIYYSGDTAYNPALLHQAIAARPDIALLPINGAFGNLDARDAARLANDLNAGICIPHHFWTFPMHLGNPQQAIEVFPQLAPACKLLLLTPGEIMLFPWIGQKHAL